MAKARGRGAVRVDYTNMLSPAAEALPSRGGGGKRKAAAEADDQLTAAATKPKNKKETKEVPVRTKKSKASSVKRKEAEDEEEHQAEEEEEEEEEEEKVEVKPKKKAKRDNGKAREAETETTTAMVVSKARRYEEQVVVRTSSPVTAGPAADEMSALRTKYDALREFRELESERLLKEAKTLAKEEKRTYDQLVAKLKTEVGTLLTRAQRVDIEHKKLQEELHAEHKLRVEALKRERDDALEASERLRRRVKELEAELASSSGRSTRAAAGRQSINAADAAAVARAGDATVELGQARKLLELYRLVSSTELRLIETLDDEDDAEHDSYTDVACAVVDSVSGKRFTFDLAVPHDTSEEVEYVPSEKPSRDFKTPSYLQDELSFKRSELTKFMRTVLDVVIRKKKNATETPKR